MKLLSVLFFALIQILVQSLYFSIIYATWFLISFEYEITKDEWDAGVHRTAQSRPKARQRQELLLSGGCISADWSFLGPRCNNSVIPQPIEPRINVTLMNLILAVLFNCCPGFQWHWPSLSNFTKYLGNQTNLIFHLAKSLFQKYNHSDYIIGVIKYCCNTMFQSFLTALPWLLTKAVNIFFTFPGRLCKK